MNTDKQPDFKADDDTEKGQPAVNRPVSTGAESNDAVEDDGTPVLDEKDLEENGLSVEDAENIVWDEPKKES
ncbi:MAG: hypothetical protein INR73_12080 [Williamsia sp.]|nr:hypothetical protein [Williamsia sp.]